jgi:hypothetical protein
MAGAEEGRARLRRGPRVGGGHHVLGLGRAVTHYYDLAL